MTAGAPTGATATGAGDGVGAPARRLPIPRWTSLRRPALAVVGRVQRRPRAVLAALCALLGAVALTLGWYGVSGEVLVARQLPYLVSGGLAGMGLLVLAAVLIGADAVVGQLRRLDRVEQQVADLHRALLASVPVAPEPVPLGATGGAAGPADGAGLDQRWVVADGGTYHLAACPLLAGKTPHLLEPGQAGGRYRPCRVCQPAPESGFPPNGTAPAAARTTAGGRPSAAGGPAAAAPGSAAEPGRWRDQR